MRINPDCQLDRTRPYEMAYGVDPTMTYKFSQDGKLFLPDGRQVILDEDEPEVVKEEPIEIKSEPEPGTTVDSTEAFNPPKTIVANNTELVKRRPGRPSLKDLTKKTTPEDAPNDLES